jgi:hypothetical protein
LAAIWNFGLIKQKSIAGQNALTKVKAAPVKQPSIFGVVSALCQSGALEGIVGSSGTGERNE